MICIFSQKASVIPTKWLYPYLGCDCPFSLLRLSWMFIRNWQKSLLRLSGMLLKFLHYYVCHYLNVVFSYGCSVLFCLHIYFFCNTTILTISFSGMKSSTHDAQSRNAVVIVDHSTKVEFSVLQPIHWRHLRSNHCRISCSSCIFFGSKFFSVANFKRSLQSLAFGPFLDSPIK